MHGRYSQWIIAMSRAFCKQCGVVEPRAVAAGLWHRATAPGLASARIWSRASQKVSLFLVTANPGPKKSVPRSRR